MKVAVFGAGGVGGYFGGRLTQSIDEVIFIARARDIDLPENAIAKTLEWIDALPSGGTTSMQRHRLPTVTGRVTTWVFNRTPLKTCSSFFKRILKKLPAYT